MANRRITLAHPVDLRRTLFPLVRGTGDPTTRVQGSTISRALRTIDGPATLRLTQVGRHEIEAEAEGPGAHAAVAHAAPGLVGALDDPNAFVRVTGSSKGSGAITARSS